MALRIHNTLTGRKEDFVPVEEGKVRMYVCGVTVYDDIHMGHARSMIVFDMVARYLRHIGYDVTHVTNFTDVDDKIMVRAAEKGMEPLELSASYIDAFFKDAESLGIRRADIYPKASECIGDIIAMVSEIIDSGYGYVTDDGSVYFSVEKVEDYGRLTNQRLEDMANQGRQVLEDTGKRNPMDFAIWKAAKPGEIAWDSPWGKGRPGWHIECSAMIGKYLGGPIDIHGGGNDLIFPHHENEILQTEAATGKPLANYWMHNGMLQVKGVGMSKEEKMSKSLGNFFRVRDVAARFDSRVIRFYFLNTHYRSPLVYGEDMLEEASAALGRLVNNYRALQSYAKSAGGSDDAAGPIGDAEKAFRDSMDDDFNTRGALEGLFALAKATNRMMAEGTLSAKGASDAVAFLKDADDVFGILPEDAADDGTLDDVMSILIDIRAELRKRKAYDLADSIRDRLADAGIVLEDSSEGARWKRV